MRRPDILTSRGRTLIRSRLRHALTRLLGRSRNDDRARAWSAHHHQLSSALISDTPSTSDRGRKKNLDAHMDALRPEFAGKPELCLHHARLCVQARRGVDPADTIDEFQFLWESQHDVLTRELNSRWLLSAVDTFADYGTHQQRAVAAMITAFFNALKLSETEIDVLHAVPGKMTLTETEEPEPVVYWDGIEGFRFRNGDMLRNLMERMERVAATDRALHAIFRTLVERACAGNSLLGRMVRANRHFGDDPWSHK